MPDKYNPFKFNILPPKAKEEIELIEERNDSVLYAIVLIFVISIVYFVIIIAQGVLVDPRLAEAASSLQSRTAAIESYAPIQAINGELFVKTKNLKPVLDKKIDSSEIFRIGEAFSALDSVEVQSYGREKSGLFVFRVISPTFEYVDDIISAAKQVEGTSDVFVRNVSKDRENSILVTTIVLNISADGTEPT